MSATVESTGGAHTVGGVVKQVWDYLDSLHLRPTHEHLLELKAEWRTYGRDEVEPSDAPPHITKVLDFNARLRDLAPPFLMLIEGEFGMGKSSLLFHSIDCSRRFDRDQIAPILPVVLTREHFSAESFHDQVSSLIFAGHSEPTPEQRNEIVRAIHNGEIILAFDGLDEAISANEVDTWAAQLRRFLLDSRGQLGSCKVIITVRSELLRLASTADFRSQADLFAFADEGKNARHLTLHALRLTGFSPRIALKYIVDRLRDDISGEELKELAQKDFAHLRRPLMAWVYCELRKLQKPQGVSQIGHSLHDGDAVPLDQAQMRLVGDYIRVASRTSRHLGPAVASRLEGYLDSNPCAEIWDSRYLSSLALESFEKSGGFASHFEYGILRHAVKAEAVTCLRDLFEDDERARSFLIHKCPFFLRTPDKEVEPGTDRWKAGDFHFVHRLFLEYFTARGVWDAESDPERRSQRFLPFDDLVLNVDMRKFLREMTAEPLTEAAPWDFTRWFQRTRYSYALGKDELDKTCCAEWALASTAIPDEVQVRALDRNRCVILAMMTYPDDPSLLATELKNIDVYLRQEGSVPVADPLEHIRAAIDQFLTDTLHEKWMHPRYLIPNLEPIAQYFIRYSCDFPRGRRFLQALELCFSHGMQKYFQTGPHTNEEFRYANGLLVERCLSIGQRMRLPIAQTWVDDDRYAISRRIENALRQANASLAADESARDSDRSLNLLRRLKQICEYIPERPLWPNRFSRETPG